jgi:hypothetical protein
MPIATRAFAVPGLAIDEPDHTNFRPHLQRATRHTRSLTLAQRRNLFRATLFVIGGVLTLLAAGLSARAAGLDAVPSQPSVNVALRVG